LPPDVLALDGFSDVLANFYQEAQIEQLWRQFEPAYERAAEGVRGPLGQIVLVSTAYLREIIRPGVRTFRVYIEPMVGNETNVRNIGDRYAVVINPASPSFDLMRHAFLHYLLDPLPLRYREKLLGEQPLLLLADRAPNLPSEYRADLTSFFDECFVRAVEFRVRRLSPAQLADEVNSAEANGYVLIRPLLKALAKFESSEPSISLYFPDLVRSIDVVSEQQRLQSVKFAPASDSQPARERAEGLGTRKEDPANAASNVEGELSAAERMIAERDPAGAAQAFERILLKVPGQPRALYGLAVASVLQGEADRARTLFEQVVALAHDESPQMRPEPATLAWSHIYLGRMHDLEEDREQALEEYRAALAIDNASEAARSAAQRGIEQPYRPAVSRPSPE
jgi:tetratricopeptide (TPR) repeat protein